MNLDGFLELLTASGQRVLAEAAELTARHGPVTAAARLRRDHPADLVAAALTQVALRERARRKFGPEAGRMYFTPEGLEQATRPEVAAHRARRLGRPGARVADLCCGIGGDLLALARAGRTVTGVDRDPLTAAVARANAAALRLDRRATVRTAPVEEVDPAAYDAVFLDPARRGAAGRVFDPMAYSPPWPQALELAGRAPAGCVKAAPGLPYHAVPDGAEVEWISYRGEVKEAAVWLGAAAEPGPERFTRRATLLPAGVTLRADPDLPPAEPGPVGGYLYEPDGAAVRAHLVAEVAALVGGRLLDPRIAYITADEPVFTPWAACYEILETMPFSGKRLRAALRARNVGNVTIKKRGSAVDVARLQKELRPSGDESLVVVLTRIGDKPVAMLCTPLPGPGAGTGPGV